MNNWGQRVAVYMKYWGFLKFSSSIYLRELCKWCSCKSFCPKEKDNNIGVVELNYLICMNVYIYENKTLFDFDFERVAKWVDHARFAPWRCGFESPFLWMSLPLFGLNIQNISLGSTPLDLYEVQWNIVSQNFLILLIFGLILNMMGLNIIILFFLPSV